MGKKISDFLKSEIISSMFYLVFGLCLILIPEQTIHMICKVVFGVVMIGAGIYHIWIYAGEKEKATILDLFTGVIVFVLGGFLFFTPQIIVKILPYLLGAFVLVDNIWMLKGSRKLKKLGNPNWKPLLIGSAGFAVLGIIVMVYPFGKITDTVFFAGCVMLADGLCDLVFLYLLKSGVKKGMLAPKEDSAQSPGEQKDSTENDDSRKKKKFGISFGREKKKEEVQEAEADEGENEDELENEVIVNGRWKAAPEEESPEKEIRDMQESDTGNTEAEEETEAEMSLEEEKPRLLEKEEKSEEASGNVIQEEEILEEWKD